MNFAARKLQREFRGAVVMAFVMMALLACWCPALRAQSYRGAIRGTVFDQSRAVIPGALVTAKERGTGLTRSAASGEDGTYVITELPAGEYQLKADLTGLKSYGAVATVQVGVETLLDLVMYPESADVHIEVSSATPIMETTQDILGGTVEEQLVTELPLNGRDFGKLVALVPGVVVEGSGVAGTEKGFGQFNVNGNRDRSNNYTLDGTDNNDPWFNNSALNQVGITGAPATLLPIDAIQEFNLQSQFPPEYGRNSGGVVNIITKSGTNDLHGSAFGYFRNSFFDARNYFNPTGNEQTLFINDQFGGSVGGPIVRDKTFFFGAYEGQRERVGSDFTAFVPTQTQINTAAQTAKAAGVNVTPLLAILSYFPTNTSQSNFIPDVVNDTNNLDNFILKVDHRFNSAHALAVRYAFGQNSQEFPFGSLGGSGSGSRLAPFAQISPTRVQVVSASLLSTLSGTHVNELRFGYTRFRNSFTSQDALTPKPIGLDFGTGHTGLPEIDFNSIFENLGATVFSIPRARVSQNYQILDNFTWIRGKHTLKFGGENRRAWVSAFNDNFERGILSFSAPSGPMQGIEALTNFFMGATSSTPSAETGSTQRLTITNGFAFFAQDEFRVRPNLTVAYGLRWEYFGPISESHDLLSNFPGPFSPTQQLVMVGHGGLDGAYKRDLKDFGPRVSVAWNPAHNTVVRAGYGIYYDYVPQDLLIANFTFTAGLATNPIGPEPVVNLNYNQGAFNGTAPGAVFSGTSLINSIFVTPRRLDTPYVGEWNLNIQQQVSKGAAIEIGYVGSKGTRLTRLFDANQDLTNPSFSQVATFATISDSTYNALQIQGRFSNWHRLSGFTAYVFSKSLDGASDGIDFNFATAAFPQNSDNLKAEKGPSTFDARHRWTTALNYAAPAWSALPKKLGEGWQANTIVTVMSGQPIGIIDGNNFGGINSHQRPNVLPGVDPILHGSPAFGYINPLAFSDPPLTGFGNLGRDAIYGPGFWNIDFSVTKDMPLTERLKLQLRAEFFNVFNHPQFALPGGTISPGAAPHDPNGCSGCFSTQTPDVAQGNPGLGGGGPRVLQLAARFTF